MCFLSLARRRCYTTIAYFELVVTTVRQYEPCILLRFLLQLTFGVLPK